MDCNGFVELVENETHAGEPVPWAITRSYCAPREGYCVWVGEKSFFRTNLADALQSATDFMEGR